ncbi:hypothetical protein ACJMK2_016006 [Sinanodonta woodiana]|uniref:C2H2-type domain-containing protein n=1 Tax=Sinanodonta woodiana TaxID=1069815 RepID=A0ABD3US81_SINWO
MDTPVLESLSFPASSDSSVQEDTQNSAGNLMSHTAIPCLMCSQAKFCLPSQEKELLQHLFANHKLVIADVNLIPDLKSYILYWKQRLKDEKPEDFFSIIKTEKKDKNETKEEEYYLLSDTHPEDRQLRDFLQRRRLERVLGCQQKEREDMQFSRGCLFCKQHFTGKRALLFDHMAEDHNFNIGQPDNLVFTDELLAKLDEKLNSLQCLYCEKTFRDRNTLKEHMRKKQHRKINPMNTEYDQFYVINYLEIGKNWEAIQSQKDIPEDIDDTDDTESDDEWSGWEEEAGCQAVCLFCEFTSSNAEKLRSHMSELHDFDLQDIKLRLALNFYQQVKLVNFIRRQVHLGICIGCQQKFETKEELIDHMHQEVHTNQIAEQAIWDQPQYFFPTYENDNLLCQLDFEDDNSPEDENSIQRNPEVPVLAEVRAIPETILSEERLRKEIIMS